jgi:hypothetical protein
MKCKCGTSAELKVFDTFQYHYCPSCRVEVVEQVAKRDTIWTARPSDDPPDWLKGANLNDLFFDWYEDMKKHSSLVDADEPMPLPTEPGFYALKSSDEACYAYFTGAHWATEEEMKRLYDAPKKGDNSAAKC